MSARKLHKRIAGALLAVTASLTFAATTPDGTWLEDLAKWRAKADAGLKRDRGWLSIVSRDELSPGANRIGSAPGSEVLLPKGLAPAYLGTVDVSGNKVRLTLANGQKMRPVVKGGTGEDFTTYEVLASDERVEWVTAGRLSLQFVRRDDGKIVVRSADRDSPRAKQFAGRLWYEPNSAFKLPARFTPKPDGAMIPIANVRGEISYEKVAGTLEFVLNGQPVRLDALDDDGDLFIIFRDATSGAGSYPAGRFLSMEKPKDGVWVVDLNRAYNPPCAFSAYTTCPLPPPQNWLKVAVPAGERYAEHKP